jgi:ABC-type nitrate/sulfonate/bicarbonate transport system substrate-binding protein
LIEAEKGSARVIAKRLDDQVSAEDRKSWEGGTPTDWANESWKSRGGTMKKSLLLLFLLAIGGGLNAAEAQPLPVRVGYTALSGAFTPVWMAKELDLFERHGIQSSPIYMAATLAYQAMLAGETDFTVGTGIAPVQARLGGADPIIVVTYASGFNFSVIARPPVQQPGDLRGKRIGVNRFGAGTDFGARIALKR